jgi:lipopolysaccharide heptosyltransferase III
MSRANSVLMREPLTTIASGVKGTDISMDQEIAFDCRYFVGDRPCIWHKREGLRCTCERYESVREQVLIIKLDAMGDVLRTTTLLPALAQAHPHAAISWITRQESKPLLENNPFLSEVCAYGPDATTMLQVREFHRVINLDAGRLSAGLAAFARSERKDGYVLGSDGRVQPTNGPAREWLALGLFDDLKKTNTRTYQSRMADIVGLADKAGPYVLDLREQELEGARAHLANLGIDPHLPIVGLNTGAGERWELKQWRLSGFRQLIAQLHQGPRVQVVLLGGRSERSRHEQLRQMDGISVVDTGNDNALRHFAALIACCDVIVSGDTLAMHIALATKRRVVVLFGPTSNSEIELYELGEKVIPKMDCLVCYKERCDYVPNCMDLISADAVQEAIYRQLRRVSRS